MCEFHNLWGDASRQVCPVIDLSTTVPRIERYRYHITAQEVVMHRRTVSAHAPPINTTVLTKLVQYPAWMGGLWGIDFTVPYK